MHIAFDALSQMQPIMKSAASAEANKMEIPLFHSKVLKPSLKGIFLFI